MTAPKHPPVSQEVKDRFAIYHSKNPAWGHLHIVLDDCNVRDCHVADCQKQAARFGDREAFELCDELLKMSKTQRLRLAKGGL